MLDICQRPSSCVQCWRSENVNILPTLVPRPANALNAFVALCAQQQAPMESREVTCASLPSIPSRPKPRIQSGLMSSNPAGFHSYPTPLQPWTTNPISTACTVNRHCGNSIKSRGPLNPTQGAPTSVSVVVK